MPKILNIRISDNASSQVSRSRIYRRIGTWEEIGVGTAAEKHTVVLKDGFSFDKEVYRQEGIFNSVHNTMCGIHTSCKWVPPKEVKVKKPVNQKLAEQLPEVPYKPTEAERVEALLNFGK